MDKSVLADLMMAATEAGEAATKAMQNIKDKSVRPAMKSTKDKFVKPAMKATKAMKAADSFTDVNAIAYELNFDIP